MAAQKRSFMALMAVLSLAICSAQYRVRSPTPEPENSVEPDPGRVLDETSDPDMVWEGNAHGGGSGGFGYGSGSGGAGGGGGWSGGDLPGHSGNNPGAGGFGGGYGDGSGSGGGSDGHGGNGGGGYGYGGRSVGNVPPKFEIDPEYPYYCKAVGCYNGDGCPGFTVYLGRH